MFARCVSTDIRNSFDSHETAMAAGIERIHVSFSSTLGENLKFQPAAKIKFFDSLFCTRLPRKNTASRIKNFSNITFFYKVVCAN